MTSSKWLGELGIKNLKVYDKVFFVDSCGDLGWGEKLYGESDNRINMEFWRNIEGWGSFKNNTTFKVKDESMWSFSVKGWFFYFV